MEDFKIVGGLEAVPHQFPFQVNLRHDGDFFCGGSILSTMYILTAAHCVGDIRPEQIQRLSVVAGDHIISKDEGNEQWRNVTQIYTHGGYRNKFHDIAILKLQLPLEFNKFVKPISYPKEPFNFPSKANVTGWGRRKSNQRELSDVLLWVSVPMVSHDFCRTQYSELNYTITKYMVCAGEHLRDSCQGDSGGPLICKSSSGEDVLCGIVSFGRGCGVRNYPGVYTDVSKYFDWIQSFADSCSPHCNRPSAVNLNKWTSFQATTPCCTKMVIGFNKDRDGMILDTETQAKPDRGGASSTWRLVPGILKPELYSIESLAYPGQYLRHQGGRVKLSSDDGSQLMKADATWYIRPTGNPGEIRFESYNYPGSFIRHFNAELWIANGDGTGYAPNAAWVFNEDITYKVIAPLAK